MIETTHPQAMPSGDDWLDGALRAGHPGPIDDEGFTARVMSALPAPAAAALPAWRTPVVAVLWTLAIIGIAASLPGLIQSAVREAYRVFTAYPVSLLQLTMAIGAAAIVLWAATAYAVRTELAIDV